MPHVPICASVSGSLRYPSVSTLYQDVFPFPCAHAFSVVSTHWYSSPLIPTPKCADTCDCGLWNHASVPSSVPCMTCSTSPRAGRSTPDDLPGTGPFHVANGHFIMASILLRL